MNFRLEINYTWLLFMIISLVIGWFYQGPLGAALILFSLVNLTHEGIHLFIAWFLAVKVVYAHLGWPGSFIEVDTTDNARLAVVYSVGFLWDFVFISGIFISLSYARFWWFIFGMVIICLWMRVQVSTPGSDYNMAESLMVESP